MTLNRARVRTDSGVIQPLPESFQQILHQLATALGVKKFILYGGAAIDLLVDPSRSVRDLDIAVPLDKLDTAGIKRNLRRSGYEILGNDREYFLNIIDPVTIVFAKNNQWILDIAFLGGPLERKITVTPPSAFHTSMDKFDIDSLFWRYPQQDIVDLYDAFGALRAKTMRPLYSLYEENPYLLINRMISLCAKYELAICNNPMHQRSFEVLAERILHWQHPGNFHGQLVKTAHYSTILKAIRRAPDRGSFIADLVSSNILLFTMPELQEALARGLSAQQLRLLNTAVTKEDLANLLMKFIDSEKQAALRERFLSLGVRTWDLEDQAVNNRV